MKQVTQKQVSENPFFGCKALLRMQRELEKGADSIPVGTVQTLLTQAWQEAQTDEQKQLFFILIFACGDISNRQHNMFVKKVDQGGHSKRKIFRYCLQWMLDSTPEYFYKFLPLIPEYSNYENLFYNQIRTDKKSKQVLSDEFLTIDYTKVATHLANRMTAEDIDEFELLCIAKFLPKIPQKNRWRKNTTTKASYKHIKRPATLRKDERTMKLINAVCKACDWDKEAYRKFRSEHLARTEAHLFSSKEITQFDRVQFITWLEEQPSDARHRVQMRLIDKEGAMLTSNGKWKLATGEDMGKLYLQWMTDKEQAVKKLALLTVEDKKNMDKSELKTLQKQAKLNTGASTIYDAFVELYKSTTSGSLNLTPELNVKFQQLVDKIKIEVPVLVILDNSGSMNGRIYFSDIQFERLQFAKLVAALMLYKNPNPDLSSFMIEFNSSAKVYSDNSYANTSLGKNRFMPVNNTVKIDKLVLRDKPFIETFKQINNLIQAKGSTDLGSVARALKQWTDEDPATKQLKIEVIAEYPVWLVISDGDLNSSHSAHSSMTQFKSQMMQYFGVDPVIVLWDITPEGGRFSDSKSYFENIDNMIHVTGFNPAVINQIFSNINDLDIIDVYVSLQTIFRSNRYEPVKQLIEYIPGIPQSFDMEDFEL